MANWSNFWLASKIVVIKTSLCDTAILHSVTLRTSATTYKMWVDQSIKFFLSTYVCIYMFIQKHVSLRYRCLFIQVGFLQFCEHDHLGISLVEVIAAVGLELPNIDTIMPYCFIQAIWYTHFYKTCMYSKKYMNIYFVYFCIYLALMVQWEPYESLMDLNVWVKILPPPQPLTKHAVD